MEGLSFHRCLGENWSTVGSGRADDTDVISDGDLLRLDHHVSSIPSFPISQLASYPSRVFHRRHALPTTGQVGIGGQNKFVCVRSNEFSMQHGSNKPFPV